MRESNTVQGPVVCPVGAAPRARARGPNVVTGSPVHLVLAKRAHGSLRVSPMFASTVEVRRFSRGGTGVGAHADRKPVLS
jgi:hypothetical protein